MPPDGLHAYIRELSPLPPGIPHSQAGSPHHSLSHLRFQLPWQMCELCPDEHHHTLGAPCIFKGISVHQRCPRPQERWGRPDREPDRLISQGEGLSFCPCSTHTRVHLLNRHTQLAPTLPLGRLPQAENKCRQSCDSRPPGVSVGPRQWGPCQLPETESSWACISLSPQPRAEWRGQLVCSAGF